MRLPQATETILRLTRQSGPFPALSLALKREEKLGLWGANGSGKTTLLEHVAGIRKATNIAHAMPPGTRIAYQPQHPPRPLGWPLSVRDYARLAGLAENALPQRLQGLLGARCDRLSGGQFQQLALCATLGGGADLILLDEPTHHLDREGLAWLADALQRLPAACIIISHDRDWLAAHTHRILDLPPPA